MLNIVCTVPEVKLTLCNQLFMHSKSNTIDATLPGDGILGVPKHAGRKQCVECV